MTLAATVTEAARRFGPAPALVTETGWALSYAELDRASDEAAVGLARRGLGPGAVLGLALPSGPDYVVAYAAAAKLGAVTVGVNPRLTAHERRGALARVDPALVLATDDLADGVPAEARTEGITAPGADGGQPLAAVRVPDEAPPPLPSDPDRLVALVLTSGTTGAPKAAEFTAGHLDAVTRADVGDRWGGGGPMLASTQMAHVGFMTKLAWYLRLGGRLCLLERWRPEAVLATIAEHRITSLGGVAPQLALLLRSDAFDAHDVSCVQAIIMGGAASPPALVAEARRRFGAAYSIRYSSTESGGVGTGTAFDADDDEALHTVGRPRAGVEVVVGTVDDHGRLDAVPTGEVGEVLVRSPTVMRGYHDDPEATAATLAGGWLRTGDLGRLDDRGLLRLAGRSSEMYVRGGYNVHPQEVESVLASHPDVAEVAVVPRPDPVMGDIGVAVVVVRPGATPPGLEDLRRFAGDRLAAWKLPEAVRTVDELPLTGMQKLDRRALATRIAQDADDRA